jgi:hypothetical protein
MTGKDTDPCSFDIDPNMLSISGVFEIHISVDPEQIARLRLFTMKHKMKPILAVAQHGENPNQLMISKWTTGSVSVATERAKDIAAQLTDAGLRVVRVKVEAMASNAGVPQAPNNDTSPSHYFEFHIKIPVADDRDWDELEKLASSHGCGVSFNAFKDAVAALFTLRVAASRGYCVAEKMKDDLLAEIARAGFVAGGEVQREFSVLDTSPHYDAGWLPTL